MERCLSLYWKWLSWIVHFLFSWLYNIFLLSLRNNRYNQKLFCIWYMMCTCLCFLMNNMLQLLTGYSCNDFLFQIAIASGNVCFNISTIGDFRRNEIANFCFIDCISFFKNTKCDTITRQWQNKIHSFLAHQSLNNVGWTRSIRVGKV